MCSVTLTRPALALEPVIAALPLIGTLWYDEVGTLSMLLDEQKVLTDERLDHIATFAATDVQFSGPRMGARRRPADRAVRSVVRGVSRDHPSIQLADLVAGPDRPPPVATPDPNHLQASACTRSWFL